MPSHTGKRSSLLLIALAAILATSVQHGGQVLAAANPNRGGNDRDTSEDGVFVRDSVIAADKFEQGKRMEAAKEWPKAADIYNEILEKFQDRVVPTTVNKLNQPIKFESVAVAVQERLARWPQDGLAVYCTRFEPVAAALLDQARRNDYAALHKVLGQYFVTDSAKQAGIRLMDLYLESGEFSAAAWIGDRLLTMHPNLANDRAAILFRTVLAYHLSGNKNLAERRLEDLKKASPNEKTTVAGKEVLMVEALATQLAAPPPKAVGSAEDSWRTLGGDESRNLTGTANGRPGARIYSIKLPPMTSGSAQVERATDPKNEDIWINVMPVVDRGELFFQDGQRVFAVHLETGIPLPGWQQQYPQREGRYQLSGSLSSGPNEYGVNLAQMPQQFTLTLTDDSVVAVMGQPIVNNSPYGGVIATTGTKLVCLDRATGREKWIAEPGGLPNMGAAARYLNFSGCPLVVGDNVYVIVRGSSGGGVEDCHVACYDLPSGSFQWVSYIASAQSGGVNNMGGPRAMPSVATVRQDTLSHLAFASGRVFVMTNLGAVAAIDAYSGTTLWLSLYARDLTRARQWTGGMNMGATVSQDMPKPWEFNPVMVQDGKVFCLPTDATDLTVYDAGSGDEVKRIPLEVNYSGSVRRLTMLQAVLGNVALVAGRDCFLVIDWTKYALAQDDSKKPVDGSLLYPSALAMRGRPFVSSKYAFLPLGNKLSCFDIARSRTIDSYPRGTVQNWPDGEGPGNVVVTREHVIIANARNVSVYTDLTAVRQKYASAIRDNPADVDARLVFSEMMFNARELPDARQAMDDAIGVLGGMKSMRIGAQRDRVFSDAILFAQKLSDDQKPDYADPKVLGLVDDLYDRAAAAAVTPSQQVNYRMSRARFLLDTIKAPQRQPDFAMVARLYQEIVADPGTRIIMVSAKEGEAEQAGRFATRAIDELIAKFGASCYKAFETEAAEKLKKLSGGAGNPDQLLALAENYPNAVSVAASAMMQAAAAYEKAGDTRMASHVLRRIYWQYPRRAPADRAALVDAMAREYLKLGNASAALGRLGRFVATSGDWKLSGPLLKADGKPLAKPDGQPAASFKEAIALLQQTAANRNGAALPKLRLPPFPTPDALGEHKTLPVPFVEAKAQAVANVQAIIKPSPEDPSAWRFDRIVIWTDGHLACIEPGQATPLWTSPALAEPAQGLSWSGERLLIWTMRELALLDGANGKVIWKTEVAALAPVELIAGPAPETKAEPAARPLPPPPPPVARIGPNGRIQIVIQAVPEPAAPLPPPDGRESIRFVHALSDRLIFSTTTGRVCALDLAKGGLLWQTRLTNSRAIQQLFSTDEFTAIRMLTDNSIARIVVLDSFDGQQVYRRQFTLGAANAVINCMLSPDGTLIWTAANEVAAKDLYEPGEEPTWTKTTPGRSYAGLSYPEQLAVWGEQVLILCNGGKMIERRRMRDGSEDGLLNTVSNDNVVADAGTTRLRVLGKRVFAFSTGSGISYDLEFVASTPMKVDALMRMLTADMAITPSHVIVPVQKQVEGGGYAILCYSRTIVPARGNEPEKESGRSDYSYSFKPPSPIKAWSIVDGGVYYLSGDTLHWLRQGE